MTSCYLIYTRFPVSLRKGCTSFQILFSCW